jgi:hypothetical protein
MTVSLLVPGTSGELYVLVVYVQPTNRSVLRLMATDFTANPRVANTHTKNYAFCNSDLKDQHMLLAVDCFPETWAPLAESFRAFHHRDLLDEGLKRDGWNYDVDEMFCFLRLQVQAKSFQGVLEAKLLDSDLVTAELPVTAASAAFFERFIRACSAQHLVENHVALKEVMPAGYGERLDVVVNASREEQSQLKMEAVDAMLEGGDVASPASDDSFQSVESHSGQPATGLSTLSVAELMQTSGRGPFAVRGFIAGVSPHDLSLVCSKGYELDKLSMRYRIGDPRLRVMELFVCDEPGAVVLTASNCFTITLEGREILSFFSQDYIETFYTKAAAHGDTLREYILHHPRSLVDFKVTRKPPSDAGHARWTSNVTMADLVVSGYPMSTI